MDKSPYDQSVLNIPSLVEVIDRMSSHNGSLLGNVDGQRTYHINTTNVTNSDFYDYGQYGQEIHEAFLSNLHRHAATFSIFLSCWSFIINIIVIAACCSTKITRQDAFYTQVINFSVSNIVNSIFVLPLTVYQILHVWELGQVVCKLWVITDVCLPFIGIVILIVLSFDRLISATQTRLYSCVFEKCLKPVTLAFPWIIACIIVIPLWTAGTIPYPTVQYQCVVLLTTLAGLLSPTLTYFIPLGIIVVLSFKILLLWLQVEESGPLTTHSERHSMRNNVNNNAMLLESSVAESTNPVNKRQETIVSISVGLQAKPGNMAAVCLVNLAFTVMWFPFQCISILLPLCNSQLCVPSMELTQAITLIGAASSGVVPLCWFVDKSLRSNAWSVFRMICIKCCYREEVNHSRDSSDVDETFV